MNNLTFNFQDHEIRFVGTAENPEWIAAGVCRALGLKSKPSDLLRRFSDTEKGSYGARLHTNAAERRHLTVKEPGLYKLIFRSDSKVATEFQNWLAHEVLPAIRKQGYYGTPSTHEPPIQKELPLETPPTTSVPEITAIAEAINLVFERSRVNRRVIALATAEAIAQQHPALKTTMSIAQKYLKP
jgi:prophage antirepressor-like protein